MSNPTLLCYKISMFSLHTQMMTKAISALILLSLPLLGHAETRISYGLHHGSGYFEHDSDTEVNALTFSVSHKFNALNEIKLSSGYNKIKHTENKQEDEGVADTSLTYRYRKIFSGHHLVDMKSKIKFPTADKDKNLGTGEHDVSLGFSNYNRIHNIWLLSELFHKWRGDNKQRNMDNGYSAKLGISAITKSKISTGGFFSYHEASSNRSVAREEITLYLNYKKNKRMKGTLYIIHGLSDASAEWAGGFQLSHSLAFEK